MQSARCTHMLKAHQGNRKQVILQFTRVAQNIIITIMRIYASFF